MLIIIYFSQGFTSTKLLFVQALGEHGFPVPRAVDWNRHCVLMTLVKGYPL